MWDRNRYRLDGWDVVLFVAALGLAIWAAAAFNLETRWLVKLGFALGIGAMGLRRKLYPHDASLVYDKPERKVTMQVFPMLAVGVGALIFIIGAAICLPVFGSRDSTHVPPEVLLVPAIPLLVGACLVIVGLRRMRDGSEATRVDDPQRGILPPTPDQSRGILPPPK